jgi:hypothetical protein
LVDEAVIYREEVLTIMGVLGDIRNELERLAVSSTRTMKKRKTPEERAELAAFEARSAENLRRLRELVDEGRRELRERRAAAERGEIELSPAWPGPAT